MSKKWILISMIFMLVILSIYTYTVIRSYNDEILKEHVIDFLKERNELEYPANLMAKMAIVETRKNGDRTYYIIHQEFDNSIMKKAYNYRIIEGMRLDQYVMIEKKNRFLTYPAYKKRNSILINNQYLDKCGEDGICTFTYDGFEYELIIGGINLNHASKIKLNFKNHSSIIIDVKDKPYILEIIKMDKDFTYTLPEVEFIYD